MKYRYDAFATSQMYNHYFQQKVKMCADYAPFQMTLDTSTKTSIQCAKLLSSSKCWLNVDDPFDNINKNWNRCFNDFPIMLSYSSTMISNFMSHTQTHAHAHIPQIWSMFNLTTGHNWNCGKINYSNVIVFRYGFGPFWLMMIMSRKIVWLCHLVGWKCCTSKQKRVDCCCWRQLSYSQYKKDKNTF